MIENSNEAHIKLSNDLTISADGPDSAIKNTYIE